MNIPLTAEIHKEGEWYVAFCPEMPEANGQGRTQAECVENLKEAILLLLEDQSVCEMPEFQTGRN